MFYKKHGANLLSVQTPFKHGFPIDDPSQLMQGNCINEGDGGSHYCGFDTAGKILTHLLSNLPGSDFTKLNAKAAPEDWRQKGTIREFDQKEFFHGDEEEFKKSDFKEHGGLYFPHSCIAEDKHCNIHINMAGCWGSNDYWAKAGSGMIDYAATNDIILLFPWV